MKTKPAVFAVHDTYHIMVQPSEESIMWVKVGDKIYCDDCNGVFRSRTPVHRMIVPAKELDAAGKYTICERKVLKRSTYFPKTGEVEETEFSFRKVSNQHPRCFHIADTHNLVAEPIAAAKAYGEIDFLILNGDIPDSSDEWPFFDVIYKITSEITNGEIPIVFARGNHDLRGHLAEHMIEFIPHENGNTYFTFKMGNIWGMVLDCGEDKEDSSEEYGNMICCHAFRQRQTEFIRDVIRQEEYLAQDVKWKVIVSHNPFTMPKPEKFYIEKEIFAEWATLLDQYIKPDVMIAGHEHCTRVVPHGQPEDEIIQPCPIIIGSKPMHKDKNYVGAGIKFGENEIEVTFIDSYGNVIETCSGGQKKNA